MSNEKENQCNEGMHLMYNNRNFLVEFILPIVCVVILFFITIQISFSNNVSKGHWDRVLTSYGVGSIENFRHVYFALNDYIKKHDGRYPQGDWYKELFGDLSLDEFGDPGVVFNPLALELGDKMPDDMVMCWTCEGGWGKTEVYDPAVHKVGKNGLCYIPKHYMTNISYSNLDHVQYLRWTLDEPPQPVLDNYKVNTIYVVTFSVLGVFWLTCYRQFKNNNKIVFTIAIITFIVGFLFAGFSATLYRFDDNFVNKYVDVGEGSLFLIYLLFGIVYTLLIARLRQWFKYKRFVMWVIFLGAITGICCSCVIHMLLRYYYFIDSYGPLFYGLPFGLFAGIFLGLITGLWLDRKHNKQLPETKSEI